ncbi:DNA helicase [Bacillus phage YungSlug]|nr:DNA helicase [Bacillus phage YungSlug]
MTTKITIDNVTSTLDTSEYFYNLVDEELAIKQPGYVFSPKFKNGFWDGKIHFFNKKSRTFPTGLLKKVCAIIAHADSHEHIIFEDLRKPLIIPMPEEVRLFEPKAPNGVITLRDYQYESVKQAIEKKRGIVNVATNGGKTEIASGIIKMIFPKMRKGQRILFVTHSKELLHQSAERIERRLNIPVGKIGDGEWDLKPVTVMMIPTVSRHIKPPKVELTEKDYKGEMKSVKLLVDFLGDYVTKDGDNKKTLKNAVSVLEEQKGKKRDQGAIDILTNIITNEKNDKAVYKVFTKMKKDLKAYEKKRMGKVMEKHEEVKEMLESAICFIGDEFHRASGDTWANTLALCKNAVYRIGLTGTVDRKDETNVLKLYGCTGEILTKISNEFLISQGFSAKPTIFLQEVREPSHIEGGSDYKKAYEKGIVENEYRNQLIIDKVTNKYFAEGKVCLIIVNRKKHGEALLEGLEKNGVPCDFTHGSRKSEDRKQLLDDLSESNLKVLIATNILDEGVSVDGINMLVMAAGGKSFRQILQRVGRGLRVKEDGGGLEVYDYLDYTNKHLLKHSKERLEYYVDEKFDIKTIN